MLKWQLFSFYQFEALRKGGNMDPGCLEILSEFREYRSKHHKPKWKPVQDDVRTLPELKSTWFYIIEKFLEFDEKKLEMRWKQLLRELFEVPLKEICIKNEIWNFFFREFQNWM